MKAKELMIGDWVRITDDDTDMSYVVRISGTSSIGNIYAPMPEGVHAYPFSEDCLDPIPLTPEILEKNGLTLSLCGEHFPEDKHYVLEISVEGGYIFWTINGHEYDIMCLRFVHELQHALRLCGIEKEIEL